eukprot:1133494-Pelagomonas_calceolata.AAC.3
MIVEAMGNWWEAETGSQWIRCAWGLGCLAEHDCKEAAFTPERVCCNKKWIARNISSTVECANSWEWWCCELQRRQSARSEVVLPDALGICVIFIGICVVAIDICVIAIGICIIAIGICVVAMLFRIAEEAIYKEWGCKPLYVREGGTMPVAAVCERILKDGMPLPGHRSQLAQVEYKSLLLCCNMYLCKSGIIPASDFDQLHR